LTTGLNVHTNAASFAIAGRQDGHQPQDIRRTTVATPAAR
jgi:hypothetical protein